MKQDEIKEGQRKNIELFLNIWMKRMNLKTQKNPI